MPYVEPHPAWVSDANHQVSGLCRRAATAEGALIHEAMHAAILGKDHVVTDHLERAQYGLERTRQQVANVAYADTQLQSTAITALTSALNAVDVALRLPSAFTVRNVMRRLAALANIRHAD